MAPPPRPLSPQPLDPHAVASLSPPPRRRLLYVRQRRGWRHAAAGGRHAVNGSGRRCRGCGWSPSSSGAAAPSQFAGMGQVFSAPTKSAEKMRGRRGKEKENPLLKRICSFIWSYFGKNPTGRISELAQFYSDNHSHVVCEHGKDKFTAMMSFLEGMDKLKYVDVPGKEKTQIRVTQEAVRGLIIGILLRFRHLHSEGKTLDGCFSAENISVPLYKKFQDVFVKPYIEVKLDNLSIDAFKPYTEEGGDKDLMKLGSIIEHHIFSMETKLPSDLAQLLKLLCSEPTKNQDLIYCHVSLKGPRDQVSYFMWMYKRLLYLQKKDPNKYNNIMQKITSAAKRWRSKAKKNKFLVKLRIFSSNGKGGYSGDGKGLCRFYRNSVEHLLKISEDNKPNSEPSSTVEEEEIQDYQIAYILTEPFPEFLCDLQKAFHEENELQRLNMEDPLPPQNDVPDVADSQC